VTTSEGQYVVNNGTGNSSTFYRTGSLQSFGAAVVGEVVEISSEFTGAEAKKYHVPVTIMDAVLNAHQKIASASSDRSSN
jgi:hypothetical protein